MNKKEIKITSVGDIGRFIRAVRKESRIHQSELCDISGVSQRFLSEVENGKQTAEIGKVLHVLKCIGCDVTLRARK